MKTTFDRNTFRGSAALVSGVLTLLLLGSFSVAAPIVDGRFDPDEGYTYGFSVDFAVERVQGMVSGGELWLYQDGGTGDVTVAFTQPLTLVDNTYGKNTIGWGKHVAPSGKNHNFKDLLGSDKARFLFADLAGNTLLDVTMDYISETAKDSGQYANLGVTGGDGEVHFGSADDVLAWGSSLDYNFNVLGHVLTEDSPATDEDYTENPLFPGWLYEVTYEFQVSGDLFGQGGLGDLRIPIVHDSPNKIGKNKVYPEFGGEVPEPATLALLAVGGLGVLLRRRRRAMA